MQLATLRRRWSYVAQRGGACPFAALILWVSPVPVHPQAGTAGGQMAKEATPQFEVAVIKPTDPADENHGFHTQGRQIFMENQPLTRLISFAYAVHEEQIVNAPAWLAHDHYDIKGVPDVPGYPDLRQYQMMVQKLLADRFHLELQREQRDLTVYAMTVTRSGAKMAKSGGDPDGLPDQTGYGKGDQQVMKFTNNTMSDLALAMQSFLDKPVVDDTNLKGRFDFTLTWTPQVTVTNDANDAPGIFTAFQEELGLKLQLMKEPVGVLVIGRVERPSAN